MTSILATFIVIAVVSFKFQICNSAQANNENFWYTCDFHLEPDPDAMTMTNECRRIYSNKAGQSTVYDLYKTEADLFYKFRNKLVECESNAKICSVNENESGVSTPLLIGYDIDNRVRMYEESDMSRCYLHSNSNIDFIKCVIETRKNMMMELKRVCSNI